MSGRTTPKKDKKKVTSASDWKRGGTTELEVPSGHVCLVKRPDGLKSFMANGKIPNALMPMVEKALEGKEPETIEMKDILSDPEKLNDMMTLIDSVTVATVIEPKVHPVPEKAGYTEGDREDDLLYVDEVDLMDKMMIFTFAVGGTKDIEQFRAGTEVNVAAISDVAGVPDSAVAIVGD